MPGFAKGPPAPAFRPGGDFRFHGAWREDATGLYHLEAREYDPRTGRFLTRDPAPPDLLVPESLHPYTYANSNPQLYRDPTGLFTIIEVNITSSIEGNLQQMKTVALNYLRQRLKFQAAKVVVFVALFKKNVTQAMLMDIALGGGVRIIAITFE